MVGDCYPDSLRQCGDEVVLKAVGRAAATTASTTVDHDDDREKQVPCSSHGGGLEGSYLWEGWRGL
jgi:hypothetical protein